MTKPLTAHLQDLEKGKIFHDTLIIDRWARGVVGYITAIRPEHGTLSIEFFTYEFFREITGKPITHEEVYLFPNGYSRVTPENLNHGHYKQLLEKHKMWV